MLILQKEDRQQPTSGRVAINFREEAREALTRWTWSFGSNDRILTDYIEVRVRQEETWSRLAVRNDVWTINDINSLTVRTEEEEE